MKIDTVFVLHHLEHEPDEDKGPDGVTHIIASVCEGGSAGRDHLKRSENVLDLLGLVILDSDWRSINTPLRFYLLLRQIVGVVSLTNTSLHFVHQRFV